MTTSANQGLKAEVIATKYQWQHKLLKCGLVATAAKSLLLPPTHAPYK